MRDLLFVRQAFFCSSTHLYVCVRHGNCLSPTEKPDLYTAYADDTTFFLTDENSIVHLSEKITLFSDFLGLKPNTTKCEIIGIAVLKWVQVATSGMEFIDLRNEAIKMLGVYFSYNQKIKDNKNFYNISNMQGVLNL